MVSILDGHNVVFLRRPESLMIRGVFSSLIVNMPIIFVENTITFTSYNDDRLKVK